MKHKLVIGCKVLKNEVENIMNQCKLEYECVFLEEQLHNDPEDLKLKIQNEIDSHPDVDEFLVVYGNCGDALIGIKSMNASITLFKCHDCIDMLLSGHPLDNEKRKMSYFGSVGWLVGKEDLGFEYDHIKERNGEKKALRYVKLIHKNYTYFTYIRTNTQKEKEAIERSRILAQKLGLLFEEVDGSVDILKDLLTGKMNDKLKRIKPGETIASIIEYSD